MFVDLILIVMIIFCLVIMGYCNDSCVGLMIVIIVCKKRIVVRLLVKLISFVILYSVMLLLKLLLLSLDLIVSVILLFFRVVLGWKFGYNFILV